MQPNLQAACHYNFESLGSKKKGWEGHVQVGLSGTWGRRDSLVDIHPFINAISNQTARPNSIGYAYIWYFDQMKTTQRSGAFGFQIKDFRFYFENDFLGFQSLDKYRSGGIALYYRVGNWQFGLKHIAYTGDPYAKNAPWLEDGVFPSRSGYIDMTEAPYGNRSMGVLAATVDYRMPLRAIWGWETKVPLEQYFGMELGVDAEQIRNFFQNRLIHDSKLLPLNWGKVKNPHIPMVCKDGCPYTYHEGQVIRKALPYFQFNMNNSVLY